MHVRSVSVSSRTRHIRTGLSNAKVARAEKEENQIPTPISFSRLRWSAKLLASFHWCNSSSSSSRNQKPKTPPKKSNSSNAFISSQDVILLEDERLVVAVIFIDFLVFFFHFLGLAVLL